MHEKPTYEQLEQRVKTLEASEKKFRRLFESALVGMYRTRTKDGKILAANASLAKMMGYDSVTGFLEEYVPSDHYKDQACRWRFIDKLQVDGKVDNYEIEMERRDGSAITIALSAVMYPEYGYTEGVVVDITEQKKDHKRLEEAYDIIKRSPAVAFLWQNAQGWPVEFVSENANSLFGYSARDFISGKVPYSKVIHPKDLERVGEEVRGFSAEKGCRRFSHAPYRIITRSGKVKWLSDQTRIRRNSNGEITHYQGIVIDITKRKLAEEALLMEKNKLQEAIDEVKTLSGLIPICSNCNKIRDDQGYWNQLETFIEQHSKARFSHGVCPECSERLYGRENWYKKMKKQKC